MKKILIIAALILPLAASLGCKKDKKQPPESGGDRRVIVRYNGGEVTLAELEKELKKRHGTSLIDTDSRTVRLLLVDMVEERLLDEEAKKAGLDKRPEIEEMVNDYRRRLYREVLLRERLAAAENVTTEEANRYYNEHLEDFTEVRFRDILIRVEAGDTTEDLQVKRKKAEDILAKAKSGADFAALAQEFSDDLRTKNKGGDTGFVPVKTLPSAAVLLGSAAKLNPGELSDVIADSTGFHIIMLVDRKTAPFEKVAPAIKTVLAQQKKDSATTNLLGDLRKKYNVQVVEESLKDTFPPPHNTSQP